LGNHFKWFKALFGDLYQPWAVKTLAALEPECIFSHGEDRQRSLLSAIANQAPFNTIIGLKSVRIVPRKKGDVSRVRALVSCSLSHKLGLLMPGRARYI
jgi:hypothetical protein